MTNRRIITIDGNEAAASSAFRTNEVIAIYPITPASPMGEFCDEWSALGKKNIWGNIPDVTEMQSEAGAAGAAHGAVQAGALTTTFTASQGLLLKIPNMLKIAGEQTAFCMHVSARTLATHALSIFGDHSDVMLARTTGFAMLCSGSVQEVHDFACIGQAATLRGRVPVLHFFDGFRTSHEIAKIEELTDEDLHHMMDAEAIQAHRDRAMTPDRPIIRGTAQNPDVFFQAREACNPFYNAFAGVMQETMDRFGEMTGRRYHLFDYMGHPEAERVIVMMGSGAETAHETVEYLADKGEPVGLLRVRLFRPFDISSFMGALPPTVKSLAVLDRTKEPGSIGEPLYMDVLAALHETRNNGGLPLAQEPVVIGGRYGLSSKEFNPPMVKAIYDELAKESPKNHFTIGITDDVTHTSLEVDEEFDIEPEDTVRAVFFGLGADGTVGANKNSIKIIGEETENFAHGYFVYDSKKSGAMTISHLRFGPRQIRSSYLVRQASFVGCHQFEFLNRYDVLGYAKPGAVFLLNSPYGPEEVWDHLPQEAQEQIIEKKLKFYVIDGYAVGREAGMGTRINTIMQTCFFAISGVLPREEAIAKIKETIDKTYGKKGPEIVQRNYAAVDQAVANMHEVPVPSAASSSRRRIEFQREEAGDFFNRVQAVMIEQKGDLLPVSAFPVDGTWPVGTTQFEKRNIAQDIPVWDPGICIQCNKCALVCPHAAIRSKVYDSSHLVEAPSAFKAVKFKGKDFEDQELTIQVAAEDCTGCTLCVKVCPAKDKANPKHKALDMAPQLPLREQERVNFDFFLKIPEVDRAAVKFDVKGSQFLQPLFEFSGACTGCGETPYVKLLSQLFGDRALIANATGCSSIYGGNLPTTPWTTDRAGRGPTWSNSLFEDAAEFGFGFRLAVDQIQEQAAGLLQGLSPKIGDNLVGAILDGRVSSNGNQEAALAEQRRRIEELRTKLGGIDSPDARVLDQIADYLAKKSVWLLGGDGWAYDIGYGGLDHVLAMDRDVNILVMDTQVYSNTGGQASKATPLGAAAKFASAGKGVPRKDLGLMAMMYGQVYVASVAMGAKDQQTVKAFQEADSYAGPSIIIAYSHCIAHGYDLSFGLDQQKMAVNSGAWPLYRYDPRRVLEGKPPLQMDSGKPKERMDTYMRNEARFRMPEKLDPKRFRELLTLAQRSADTRYAVYQQLAGMMIPNPEAEGEETPADA